MSTFTRELVKDLRERLVENEAESRKLRTALTALGTPTKKRGRPRKSKSTLALPGVAVNSDEEAIQPRPRRTGVRV
jgi:hypothetical protein